MPGLVHVGMYEMLAVLDLVLTAVSTHHHDVESHGP